MPQRVLSSVKLHLLGMNGKHIQLATLTKSIAAAVLVRQHAAASALGEYVHLKMH